MFKKTVVLAIVMVMLVSFSAVTIAETKTTTGEGQAPNNKAGVRVLVDDNNDGEKEIHFLPAVNENGKENGKPTNPIAVAGK
ncbi:hypothetical protein ACTWKD_05605 [Halanaerobium saccharolyticum]|uniref:hypothetical protein n=1 Tax=Halanaerobium saccharolyticum TaxID=43595 RepID=UPI003FCEC984